MGVSEVATVVVLAAIVAGVTQLLKGFLKSEKDLDGHEVGKRRFLPFIVLLFSTPAGILWGYVRAEDLIIWGIVGFTAGLASAGYYALGKMVVPNIINSRTG